MTGLTTYLYKLYRYPMEGQELRDIRRRLGLSQTQMAPQLGVHWNSVARYERGEVGIPEPVAKLARLLLAMAKKKPKRAKKK